jgi:hypothetical protein
MVSHFILELSYVTYKETLKKEIAAWVENRNKKSVKVDWQYQHAADINGIESFWSFTKRRLAKLNGVKRSFELR